MEQEWRPELLWVVAGTLRKESKHSKHSFRKRLIYLRREFEPMDIEMTRNTYNDRKARNVEVPVQPYLNGTHLWTEESFAEHIQKTNRAPLPFCGWRELGTSFICNERLDEMRMRAGQSVNFNHFSVIVSSLLYIHQRPRIGPLNVHLQNLFKRYYRHPGTHVFLSCFGDFNLIVVVYSDFRPDSRDTEYDNKSNETILRVNSRDCVVLTCKPAPISSIYPVYRYEYDVESPKQSFCYGLYYDTYGRNSGNRYYHRLGDNCLRTGGVFELTEEKLTSKPRQYIASK